MASDEIIDLGDGKFMLHVTFPLQAPRTRSKHHGKNPGCVECGYAWTDCPNCPVCGKPLAQAEQLP